MSSATAHGRTLRPVGGADFARDVLEPDVGRVPDYVIGHTRLVAGQEKVSRGDPSLREMLGCRECLAKLEAALPRWPSA